MGNQEWRSEWSTHLITPDDIEMAMNAPLWVRELFSKFHALNQVIEQEQTEGTPAQEIEKAVSKLAKIFATIHYEAPEYIPLFMRMFALQKEIEYKVSSSVIMLKLEDVSDYLEYAIRSN